MYTRSIGGIYFSLTHIHLLFYETEELLKTAYDSFLSSEFVYSDNLLRIKLVLLKSGTYASTKAKFTSSYLIQF